MGEISLKSFVLFGCLAAFALQGRAQQKYALVIHGGAGTILKKDMSDAKEKAYRQKLEEALQAGYTQWKAGKAAVDIVQASIIILEDSPLFNAGKGAVFTHDGKNELDAAIMNGADLSAGAVAGLTVVKNPILAARAVMERSEHVMMTGHGAEQFAREAGLEIVPPSYFRTEERWNALQKALKADNLKRATSKDKKGAVFTAKNHDNKFGTVGCVALDRSGKLAAGTSTGGMTDKKYGRVGDVPIIGAGTYADSLVAVSCTGWGEYFIRATVAHNIAARMAYKKEGLKQAAAAMIGQVGEMGGDGGLIAIDKSGNMTMPFNTEGMYRAAITTDGKAEILIYGQ
ncbi:MAG: isoaspartyl peptidase/L-asparaginase [Mucilaginibacter polytrichastri]|nr:isoaspartyl peptidase/L-asparaginase [Mucilaginibacter polytrichastri]